MFILRALWFIIKLICYLLFWSVAIIIAALLWGGFGATIVALVAAYCLCNRGKI